MPVLPTPILVTGAAGFIGGHLVRRLRAGGTAVVATDVSVRDGVTSLDVTRPNDIECVLAAHRPRAVVHAAAIVDDRGDRRRFLAVNVAGTSHMLAAAQRHGVQRFVQVSSIGALGLDPGLNADEHSPLVFSSGNPYFDSKARSEALAREFFARTGLPGVIVRPGDAWGPGSVSWVERPLELMRRRLPVLVDGGRGLMAHCHVDNLVDALLLALERSAALGTTVQITDGVAHTTYREYFGRLAAAADVALPRWSFGRRSGTALAAILETLAQWTGKQPPLTRTVVNYLARQSTYSIDLAQVKLGYQPRVTLDQGMEQLRAALQQRAAACASAAG